jgi:copper(I)-binding protein
MPVLRRARAGSALALAAAMILGGCGAIARASPSMLVTGAYVPQPATGQAATVAYLAIRNNGPADQLVSVRTSAGGRVTFRAPVTHQNLAMRSLTDLAIPADATLRLVPNGPHLLITGAAPLRGGKDITLTLTFRRAGAISVVALVTDPESGGSSYFLN